MTELKSTEGFYYTQANLKEGELRVFSTHIYLGKYDSVDNWTEWTEEEKVKFQKLLKNERAIY